MFTLTTEKAVEISAFGEWSAKDRLFRRVA
jgi:hypothetical protein